MDYFLIFAPATAVVMVAGFGLGVLTSKSLGWPNGRDGRLMLAGVVMVLCFTSTLIGFSIVGARRGRIEGAKEDTKLARQYPDIATVLYEQTRPPWYLNPSVLVPVIGFLVVSLVGLFVE